LPISDSPVIEDIADLTAIEALKKTGAYKKA